MEAILSLSIVEEYLGYTVFSAFVYIRATRIEADKESGQSEEALKRRLRFRNRIGVYGSIIYSKTFGIMQRRFRYHVHSALRVRLAKKTEDAHDRSLNANQAKLKECRALSSNRLKRRIKLRNKRNPSGGTTGHKMTGKN